MRRTGLLAVVDGQHSLDPALAQAAQAGMQSVGRALVGGQLTAAGTSKAGMPVPAAGTDSSTVQATSSDHSRPTASQ
jgi:hypothetical protein